MTSGFRVKPGMTAKSRCLTVFIEKFAVVISSLPLEGGVNYYKITNSVKNLYIFLPVKRKKSLNFRHLKVGKKFAYLNI